MNKLHFLSISALLLTSTMLISCGKDSSACQFTASTEQSSKSHTAATQVVWDADDAIMVSNGTDCGKYAVAFLNGATATFECPEEENVEGDTYYAIHPSDDFVDYNIIYLPETQEYLTNSMLNAPMYAISSTRNLLFYNVCSVLKLTLQHTGSSVESIRITTDKRICGEFVTTTARTIGDNGFQVNACDDGYNTSVELLCDAPVSIDAAQDFYIYLPVGEYAQFDISIMRPDGSHADLHSSASASNTISFERNHFKSLSRTGNSLTFTE